MQRDSHGPGGGIAGPGVGWTPSTTASTVHPATLPANLVGTSQLGTAEATAKSLQPPAVPACSAVQGLTLRKGCQEHSLPGAIGQLPVKGGAAGDGGLVLREQWLALQPVGCARDWGGPGQRLQGGRGHSVPCGVLPEGGLVLAGRALAVQLVLHHGDPAEL